MVRLFSATSWIQKILLGSKIMPWAIYQCMLVNVISHHSRGERGVLPCDVEKPALDREVLRMGICDPDELEKVAKVGTDFPAKEQMIREVLRMGIHGSDELEKKAKVGTAYRAAFTLILRPN